VLSLSFLTIPLTYAQELVDQQEPIYKTIQGTQGLSWIPENYEFIDWQEKAREFNRILFDTEQYDYLFYEPGLYNTSETMLGIVTLVDDERTMKSSEAITVLTALLSANRIDAEFLNDKTLRDLARKVEAYYNANRGESTLLNRYDTPSKELSFWEQVYPSLLYFMLMDQIPPTENSDQLLKEIADTWYEVVMDLGGKSKNNGLDFAYTGYDFKTKTPYDNGQWQEMDATVGIGLIQYYAFLKFGERRYMNATLLCMDYLNEFEDHPGSHLLYFYLPYLGARLNAQEQTEYNTAKFMNDFFTQTGANNNWGWFNGLVGNSTEYGGTAYAYESLMAANALVPMLKYDPRYAKEIGRYLLHLTQELDAFYEDENVIPLNKSQHGQLSIQSGTALGLFASMINPTDVEGILRIDLNANEYYTQRQDTDHSFLLFNPHPFGEEIRYEIQSPNRVSLYNLVTQDFVAENVQNQVSLKIPAEEAMVILEIEVEEGDNQYQMNRKVEKRVLADFRASVNISNFQSQETITSNVPIELDILLRDAEFESLIILVDEEEVFHNVVYEEPYVLDINELEDGFHVLKVEMTDRTNHKDYAYANFFVNKDGNRALERDLVFEVDFSQDPLLELEILEFSKPWSLMLKDEESHASFTLLENSVDSGILRIDMNKAIKRLNKDKFDLYGQHKIYLVTEGDSDLSIGQIQVINQGILALDDREWSRPFTPKKMAQWQSRFSGTGKLNYYNGKAYVKNLNETPNGVGNVETDYFEVDLAKDVNFKISVEEVDELWALQVYVAGDSRAHYLEYPTDKTGVFKYNLTEKLRAIVPEEDHEELQNVQFIIVSEGDYDAVVKLDYLSLAYETGWIKLASAGIIGLIALTAIFVNINKEM